MKQMNELTFEERNLICIYSGSGGRSAVIAALMEMRKYLEADETELRNLTDSAAGKLTRMTDAEYNALELVPDFDLEDVDAE